MKTTPVQDRPKKTPERVKRRRQ